MPGIRGSGGGGRAGGERGSAKVRFTGLAEVRQLVDEHRDAPGHAVLLHVLNRTDRKPVIQINQAKSELEPFLDNSGADEPSREQLCDALMRRVPVEVERHWTGTGTRTTMLRLHQPKGRYLKGQSFHVELSPPPALPTVPVVVALNGEILPEARVWRALGSAFEDFVGTVVRSVTGLMDAEHRVNEHLADQLAKSWRLVEALTEQLLIERAERARLEGDRRADDGTQQFRDLLVGKLLEELASLGQAMNGGRGDVPPELVEVFETFAASPALVEAFCDPSRSGGLRAMLLDPLGCEALARHLLEAARGTGERDP